MPLDEIARCYADECYAELRNGILGEHQRKMNEVERNYPIEKRFRSDAFVSAVATSFTETIRLLAEARTETLLSAYEKAGTPFDESTLREITTELLQFMEGVEQDATYQISQFVNQAFFAYPPPNTIPTLTYGIQTEVRASLEDILRNLRIRHLQILLSEKRVPKPNDTELDNQYDVFLSYAGEDEAFVMTLVDALKKSGLSVWYAPLSLTVGDRLRKTIDGGIANSRFGVVVLSHYYFAKHWPQEELEGLFNKEVEGRKVILPVWHNVTASEIRRYSLMLSGRVAANTSDGLAVVVHQLRKAMT
jgi:TIR domain